MNDFLKMDIFFVVATISVIVVGVLLSLVLWYGLRLVKTCDRILQEVEGEAKALRADIAETRANLKREGRALSRLIDFVVSSGRKLLKGK